MIKDIQAQQKIINKYRSDLLKYISTPSYFSRFIPRKKLNWFERKRNHILLLVDRIKDAWLVLRGKAEIGDD